MNSTEMVRITETEPVGKLRWDGIWNMYLLLLPVERRTPPRHPPSMLRNTSRTNFNTFLRHLFCCTICQSSKTPACSENEEEERNLKQIPARSWIKKFLKYPVERSDSVSAMWFGQNHCIPLPPLHSGLPELPDRSVSTVCARFCDHKNQIIVQFLTLSDYASDRRQQQNVMCYKQ